MTKDYYFVLGISRGADLKKIKKAYRTIAKQHHPDVAPSQEDQERFMEVKEAYDTLGDETKRKAYDEALIREGSQLRVTEVPETIERRRSLFDEMERIYASAADDFFSGILPGFFDLDKGRIRGKDLYFEAVLSPMEAAEGGLYPVTVPVFEPCPKCARSGFWEEFFCPVCYGYGRIHAEREFSLSIPPNVKDGTQVRLSMEDIGLHGVHLNILIRIDPTL
jgi:DnaJ-class molecular chaperone